MPIKANHIDIASNYAGTMMGVTNCVASICGFLAPYVVNLIVTESVQLKYVNLKLNVSS